MAGKKLSELTPLTRLSELGSGDLLYTSASGISRSITLSKLSEYLNRRSGLCSVLDFGATGDGIHDDFPAIQAAIDATAANGGGFVMFPKGQFLISQALTPKNGVSLHGIRPELKFTQLCPDLGIMKGNGTWLLPKVLGASDGIAFNTDPFPSKDDALSNCEIMGIGFYCFKNAIIGGARDHLSMGFGRLQDLFFLGSQDGINYTRHAIALDNFQHVQINHVKAFECFEPFRFRANHKICSPGNSVFIDLYAYMGNRNNSGQFGLGLFSEDNGTQLNTLTIIRPQINWFAGGTNKRHIVLEGKGTGQITQCDLIDTNTEGDTDLHISLNNAYNCKLSIISIVSSATQANIKITSSSCVIDSQAPRAFFLLDGPSSLSPISGIIHKIQGSNIPPGTRVETGYSPQRVFTGLGRDGIGLVSTSGNSLVHQTNTQIVQQITEVSSAGNLGLITPNLAGTVFVSLTSAVNSRIQLPMVTTDRAGLEITLIRKDAMPATSLTLFPQTGQSISGKPSLNLPQQWDYVRLLAANDQLNWVIIATNLTFI